MLDPDPTDPGAILPGEVDVGTEDAHRPEGDDPTDLDLVTDHPYQPSEWGDRCGHLVRGWPCGFGIAEHERYE